jgi:hypothetical protein
VAARCAAVAAAAAAASADGVSRCRQLEDMHSWRRVTSLVDVCRRSAVAD